MGQRDLCWILDLQPGNSLFFVINAARLAVFNELFSQQIGNGRRRLADMRLQQLFFVLANK